MPCSLTNSRELKALGKDCAYGAAGSAASLSVGFGVMQGSICLLDRLGIDAQPKTYFRLYEFVSTIRAPLLRAAFKTASIVLVVILGPLFEEWLFRGVVYNWQEGSASFPETMCARVWRVVTNGALFGAIHFHFLLGWANIPILLVTMVAGVTFATLREYTGSWKAPLFAHCLNNAIVISSYFLER